MQIDDIYERLTLIFRDIFDDDSLVAVPELSADDVGGWDSFAHLRLIVTVEKTFNVSFTAAQVDELKNVGDLAELIQKKAS